MTLKPDVKPGTPCGFPSCATDKCAVHEHEGRKLCAFHSPYDVDWSNDCE